MMGISERELGSRLLNELEAELLARFESEAALTGADAGTSSRFAQQLEAAAQPVLGRGVKLDAKRLLARAVVTARSSAFADTACWSRIMAVGLGSVWVVQQQAFISSHATT